MTSSVLLLALVVLAVGVAGTILVRSLWQDSESSLVVVFDRICTAAISAGFIAFLWNLMTRRKLVTELLEVVGVRESQKALGISDTGLHYPPERIIDDAFKLDYLSVICVCDLDLRDRYRIQMQELLRRGGTILVTIPDWSDPLVLNEIERRNLSPLTPADMHRLEDYLSRELQEEIIANEWLGTVAVRKIKFLPAYTSYVFGSKGNQVTLIRVLGNSLVHTGQNPLFVLSPGGSLKEFVDRDIALMEKYAMFS